MPLQTPTPVSKLSTLRPSFSELDYESQLNLILGIRSNRRISKRPAEKAKKDRTLAPSKRAPTKTSVRALLSKLSPEDALALLEQLQAQQSSPESSQS